MDYNFYRSSHNHNIKVELPEGLSVVKCIPHLSIDGMTHFNLPFKKWLSIAVQTILWGGYKAKFVEYDLIKDRKIISKELLISRIPRYFFLPKGGVHLCCGETLACERGHGYHNLLQQYIIAVNPDMDLHAIVRQDNLSSIRCVEKSGFVKYATGRRNKKGIAEIVEYIK